MFVYTEMYFVASWSPGTVRKRRLNAVGIRCADHVTPLSAKLALTSPTSGGRSFGIVHLRTTGSWVCLWSQGIQLHGNVFVNAFSSNEPICHNTIYLYNFRAISNDMKKAVFWDVAPCRSGVNRRFGGTYRLHLQGIGEIKKIRTRSVRQRR
jgi:hypothetical protein